MASMASFFPVKTVKAVSLEHLVHQLLHALIHAIKLDEVCLCVFVKGVV